MHIFSFKPGLFCLNMIGDPSLNLTKSININNKGMRIINATSDKIKSKIL